MTPSEKLVKVLHMAIERERGLLDGMTVDGTHLIRAIVKPRPDGWRVSISIETQERRV